MIRSAIISPCGLYRYRLERNVLPDGAVGMFCWVNPSTADAEVEDASTRKGVGFATRLKWRKYILVNPFAYRTKDIRDLRLVRDPVGPENDHHIEQAMRDADIHVVGWARWRSCRNRCGAGGKTSCGSLNASGASCIVSASAMMDTRGTR
jgi:hypothetical protein